MMNGGNVTERLRSDQLITVSDQYQSVLVPESISNSDRINVTMSINVGLAKPDITLVI